MKKNNDNIAIEWTDSHGKHHFKILSNFAAKKYINMLVEQDCKVSYYATQHS
jgi:hypothetical protein